MGFYSNNPEYFRRGGKYYSGRGSSNNRNGDVVVSGFDENSVTLGQLMTTDPHMAGILRKYIRQLLKEARKNLSQDAKNYLKNDPRKAARAVKFSVYKSFFGGNVSILQKKAGTAGAKYMLIRQRKVEQNPKMRGGNRIQRVNDDRNRLDTYFGADRGYVLRFISSGTIGRQSRYGNRGSIRRTGWFGHTAPWQMETAAKKLAEAITEYIKHETNG